MRAAKLQEWRALAKEAMERTLIVAKFLSLLHVVDTYICSSTLVYGPSMLPTLNFRGDVLLFERFSHRLGKSGLGDVVLLQSPQNPKKTLTKRIIAVEGDRVSVAANPFNSGVSGTVVVPKGHVWVQGDNSYASHDSRHFGPVPFGLIQGTVFCRVWPLDEFGSLDR